MRSVVLVCLALFMGAVGCSKKDKGGPAATSPYYTDPYYQQNGYGNGYGNCGFSNLPAPYYRFNAARQCVDTRNGQVLPPQENYRCQSSNWRAGTPTSGPGFPNHPGHGGFPGQFNPTCNYHSQYGTYQFNYHFTGICQQLTMYNPGKMYLEINRNGTAICVEYAAAYQYGFQVPPNYWQNPYTLYSSSCAYGGSCGCAGAYVNFGIFPILGLGFSYGACR